MKGRKTIFFVGCVFLMNINMVKSMEIQKHIPHIPEDKIFILDHRNSNEKYFQLCKDGSQLEVTQKVFSQISHAYYCAKILMKKEKDNKDFFSQFWNEPTSSLISKDMVIQPISEVTPDMVNFVRPFLREFSLLPIKLTNDQIKIIKQKTKRITLVKDEQGTKIRDTSGSDIDIVVLDDLHNAYRLIGVFEMEAEDI